MTDKEFKDTFLANMSVSDEDGTTKTIVFRKESGCWNLIKIRTSSRFDEFIEVAGKAIVFGAMLLTIYTIVRGAFFLLKG